MLTKNKTKVEKPWKRSSFQDVENAQIFKITEVDKINKPVGEPIEVQIHKDVCTISTLLKEAKSYQEKVFHENDAA